MGPIILCHAFEDQKVVRGVYEALLASGFEVWIDSEAVCGEHAWESDMAQWLAQATCMLVFLSKNSVRKMGATRHEFGRLIQTWKHMPAGTVRTIPVRINDCQIPDLLSRLDHIDLFDDQGLEHVIRCLREDRAKRQPRPHGCDEPASGEKPREKGRDEALGEGFHVAVDGRGEVVETSRAVNDQPRGGETATDAMKEESRGGTAHH